jgi:hypothetical protein
LNTTKILQDSIRIAFAPAADPSVLVPPSAEELLDLDLAQRLAVTYLHSCISTRRHRVRVPEVPMYLDAILVDEPLVGGLEPRLGKAQLRTLTVMGFPSTTHPGILDELNRLAFPYRWSTRAIALDKTDATKVLNHQVRSSESVWLTAEEGRQAVIVPRCCATSSLQKLP